jgi:hypothetical protein
MTLRPPCLRGNVFQPMISFATYSGMIGLAGG